MEKENKRYRMDCWNEAQKAIQKAINEVELMGADTKLTDAVYLLLKAGDAVYEYLETQQMMDNPDTFSVHPETDPIC